jgi:Rps23 Pro-64 3,4-dihydroxylase Tpa1-like proline 4-hydroxylase
MNVYSPVTQQFINRDVLASFPVEAFHTTTPFPWYNFHQFLRPEAFQTLYQDFPSLEVFEKHLEIDRGNGQRPHNRYYLAYEKSIYRSSQTGPGVIVQSDLPQSWQRFIEEIETSEEYHALIRSALGVTKFKMRYAWHVGFSGCEVSPHVDSSDKAGTHILYFNTVQDWEPSWGGEILVLGDRQTDVLNPDYGDFTMTTAVKILGNQSFFFKNTPTSWHGVQPLTCPGEKYRRLFNIIFEYPEARTVLNSPIVRSVGKFIPFQPLRSLARNLLIR